jgi:hypothetical protein
MDDRNCLCVFAEAGEVSRAFEEPESKEAEAPQKRCDSTEAK